MSETAALRLDQHLDPRLTPARPDLAATHLRGRVKATRFVDGRRRRVLVETADLKREPRPDAPLDTQLLYGEMVTVYDDDEGWSWVQAERDGYVGYVASHSLGKPAGDATHRVVANRTFVYPAPDMKRSILAAVPLDGRVTVLEDLGDFCGLDTGGFVYRAHLAPVSDRQLDAVAIAERLIGTPYLWGGRSAAGIDCSGLVQLALSMANVAMPRDTDLQEAHGELVETDASLSGLRRGDLVFWKGHVGVMSDERHVVHANGYHMLVIRESLSATQDRIRTTTGLEISSVRRPF